MRIVEFEITNFKGIRSTKIEIETVAPGNVVTLIGLNESGKTTILEAISNFVSVDESTSSVINVIGSRQRPSEFIPRINKGAFTGEISVLARIRLEDDDVIALTEALNRQFSIRIQSDKLNRLITVRRVYYFENSDLTRSSNNWITDIPFIRGRGKTVHSASHSDNYDIWDSATNLLQDRFPKIVYFPTFLINVPDRIYLEDHPKWPEHDQRAVINRYFREILQDVAVSIDHNLSIETHIVERVRRKRVRSTNPLLFWAEFLQADEAAQIQAVINRLAAKVTRTVFGSWNEISDRTVYGKTVKMNWAVDQESGNLPYISITINDGESDFALRERSLGFRWFFTFLLFTQFRKSRRVDQGTIFLFDEPASNLHARAQTKLLESFDSTGNENQYIVYSTHSHYMINPSWLEKAFIIEDQGVDFAAKSSDEDFSGAHTDIKATRYRAFVASNPTRVSYFQPALDALKFSFGPLEAGKYALVVEGKFDFHPIKYFQQRSGSLLFNIIPAPSASEAGSLISLLRGFGTRFCVLLDDDDAGRGACQRYRNEHLLSDKEAFTLVDFDTIWRNGCFEAAYGPEVKALASSGPSPTKGQYSLLFQQLTHDKDFFIDLGNTTTVVSKLIDTIAERLGASKSKATSPRTSKGKTPRGN